VSDLVGRTLSHYRIVEKIGAGGMGEVYRARDTRLERDVAVKSLPAAVSTDPDRLARFVREAKILASLNHPNIAAIFGLEELPSGERFLILELLEGETLAERITRTPLSPAEGARICAAIAAALEAAHGRGAIHLDLKPGNIILLPGVGVKVLDFGIARRVGGSRGSMESTMTATEEGGMVGTPGYMSPEQIRGEVLDERSDLFSLGCVLYECLSGRRAFTGRTPMDAFAATLTSEPAWSSLPQGTPSRLEAVLKRCLAKEPKHRPRSAGEVRNALDGLDRSSVLVETKSATPNNLPPDLTSFVGRRRELAEGSRLLSTARLLTMTGVGGCGKTRLATRIASQHGKHFPDGIWFVDLAPIQDGGRVPFAVADAVGIHEEPGRPILETILDRLSRKRALIVLDNCEHVLSACGLLAQRLLVAAAEVSILATSREILGIAGEQNVPVPPLSLLEADAVPGAEDWDASEAVTLFVDRARLARPDFQLDERLGRTVLGICTRVDGIPLAIELAAARIGHLSAEQILAKLDNVFRVLAAGNKTLPRHQTLHAAMDWSHDLLTLDERRLFRRLSVFVGGTTLEGAAAILDPGTDEFEAIELLTRLVNKSLVVADVAAGSNPRYRMLETVRQYGRERLSEAGETDSARDSHLRFYVAFAEAAAAKLPTAEQAEWLDRIDRDRENILAAHRWCDEAAEGAEMGLRLAGATRLYWLNRGKFELGLQVMREAIARDRARVPSPERVQALYGEGSLTYAVGDYTSASASLAESVALSRSIGDRVGVSRALHMLGAVATAQKDNAAARTHLEEVIVIARETGDVRRLSAGLGSLAECHRVEGRLDEAAPLYEEALVLAQESGNVDSAAVCLLNCAALDILRGSRDDSRRRAAQAVEIVQEIGSMRLGQASLDLAAGLAAAYGEWSLSARFYGASQAVLQRMGARREPVDEEFLAPLLAQARRTMGEESFAEVEAQGTGIPYDEAMAETRAWLGLRGTT